MFDVIKSTLAVETVFDFIYIIDYPDSKTISISSNIAQDLIRSSWWLISRIVLKTEYIIFKELVNNIIYVVRLSAIVNHSWGLDSGHYGVGMADILWRCSKRS